jgi:hypothetical protein
MDAAPEPAALVIADDFVLRTRYATLLRSLVPNVIAGSLHQAREHLRNGPPFIVVVIDDDVDAIFLPEIWRRRIDSPELRRAAVTVVTADPELADVAEEMGFHPLPKPLPPMALRRFVNEALASVANAARTSTAA